MTIRNLGALFHPKSVAVIGATQRAGRSGRMAWQRLIEGGFDGPLWPVNPKYVHEPDGFDGHVVFADVSNLPSAPAVALICTPPHTWPDLVSQLGSLGAHAVILVEQAETDSDRADLRRALKAARPHLLRIVGPGSAGVITPARHAQLGAFVCAARAGGVAWVSQSNALTNSVLAWANTRGLGFSHVIALGDEADVDIGDVLDYLASDASTRAILLEVDSVRAARKFMSAARAAARNKPVLALRSGRSESGDALYSAAFRRSGIVRVESLDDLLDEIETFGVGRVAASDTATLITSDRGVAALARDAFMSTGDTLAQWDDAALEAVRNALPHASVGNPLLLGEDAQPEHFGLALDALASHRSTGTAFVFHAPTHNVSGDEVARTLIAHQKVAYRGLLACFFGGVSAETRDALHASGIPVHTTPRRLARAFARLVDYRLSRELLMQTPDIVSSCETSAIEAAQTQARDALAAGKRQLTEEDAAKLLGQFGLQIQAQAEAEAEMETAKLATSASMLSSEIPAHHAFALEIEVTFHDDENFGPVFHFVVPSPDGAAPLRHLYELPPLNPMLSGDIIRRSPYSKVIAPEPTLAALTGMSQAVCDVREIVGMQFTMRLLPTKTVLIAPRIELSATRSRMAIMPYPRRLEETIDWHGAHMTIRPIRPEDEAQHRAFIEAMSPEDLQLRFFSAVRSFDHSQLARMTQIDYDREMALIAIMQEKNGAPYTLGVVRAVTDPDNEAAEFAVMVSTHRKGKGLGRLLMRRIIDYTRSRSTRWIVGEALRENAGMIALARSAGFTVTTTDDPSVVGFKLALNIPDPEQETSTKGIAR